MSIVQVDDVVLAQGSAYPTCPVRLHHTQPWTDEYQRDAVSVFVTYLPASYQLAVGGFFCRSSEVMADQTVPGHLVEDWMIVMRYLDSVATAVLAHYADSQSDKLKPFVRHVAEAAVSESLPMVVRFDLLARLTSSEGARRLERAAVAVRDHMDAPLPALDDIERAMLIQLKAGVAIVDIAAELGYSERSMYRSLARLWDKLGASDRKEGIRRATEEGLLD